MNNPMKLNDWNIKKFISFVLLIQVLLILMAVSNFKIPLVNQIIGFIYLTFVPGFLIMRILKIHKLKNVETVLYSIGLSLFSLMIVGLFINTLYPVFGITKPLSPTSLLVTLIITTLILTAISFLRDKNFNYSHSIDLNDLITPMNLLFCLLPFIAIIGSYFVNFYNNNVFLIVLVILISLIPLLITFTNLIPKRSYPFIIFIISISLVFSQSLISMYIWGADIHVEHYLSSLFQNLGYWDSNLPLISYNGMLSIVMLLPIYSNIMGLDITWIEKIIYPFFLALIPVGLFTVFKSQTNSKIAFLACFYFMAVFTFYTELLYTQRQILSEFFFVLFLMVLFTYKKSDITKSILTIAFISSIALSHYSVTYLLIVALILSWILGRSIDLLPLNIKKRLDFKETANGTPLSVGISLTLIILFITLSLGWYMYNSIQAFNSIVSIINNIISNFASDFLNPDVSQGIFYATKKTATINHSITKYLYLISQFFIALGILSLFQRNGKMNFSKGYVTLALVYFAYCIGSVVVPYFAGALDTIRLFQITLIFLAPFVVIGALTAFKITVKIFKCDWNSKRKESSLKITALFLTVFLLFNSGLIYEITNDPVPSSISLSSDKINYPIFNQREVAAAQWWAKVKNNRHIYADFYRYLLLGGFKWDQAAPFPDIENNKNFMLRNTDVYIFVGTWNIENQKVIFFSKKTMTLTEITKNKSKIFDDGGASIWY